MSKLNVDQKSIKSLFEAKGADFLIPDYQRPYAWGEDECQTLWDDIFAFAFPEDDSDKFDRNNDEYYLGPIVTFRNDEGKQEVIDGQQRLTTLMLLLRAFHTKFLYMQDKNSKNTRETIESCIWKTDEFGNPDYDDLKIDSEVATDNDKEEFLSILKTGTVLDGQKSNYAQNYKLFLKNIDEFLQTYPGYFPYLPTRILNNCILLPIEAESQNTALRIFSTLNDRGLPLSDADIFKAQFYNYYKSKGEKDLFIERWKALESKCNELFHPAQGTPMDELFTRYMYYLRAKKGNRKTTVDALRRFYETNKYEILKNDETFSDLENLAAFWEKVENQDADMFDERIRKRLMILQYAPNGMWTYMVSVYFLAKRDAECNLSADEFLRFLNIITAFIWAYSIVRPGVNALRTPVFPELIKIVNGEAINFSDYLFDYDNTLNALKNYLFTNQRPATKAMLVWWAFNSEDQQLMSSDTRFDIEHIYAKKRQEIEKSLKSKDSLESLGNKSILEKNINIRAADYRLCDKKKYYTGYTTDKGVVKEGTKIKELLSIAESYDDFTEVDIDSRKSKILFSFMDYLSENGLIQA